MPDNLTETLLRPLLQGDARTPRLTTYVGGFRTELSTASLANWSAKVAGLLLDELGLQPGDGVHVAVGAGWQTAPILLGTWWAGLTVHDDESGSMVSFVPDGGDAGTDEVFVVSGHPLGAPSQQVAAHQRDFTTAVLPQADRFSPRGPAGSRAVATRGGRALTITELLMASSSVGLEPGSRLASNELWTLPDGVVSGLLGALAAGGSLVWSDSAEAELVDQARAERATVTAGFAVPGLPQLD